MSVSTSSLLTLPLLLDVLLPASGSRSERTLGGPQNVLLSRGRTEPVVAVDPRNPSIIVAAANTNYSAPVAGTYPLGRYSSRDGGRSFIAGSAPVLSPYTTEADPTLTFARSGTVFFSYLGETPAYCSGGRSAVLLTTSTDGGANFRIPTTVDTSSADDKPNMAVESFVHHRAHIFVTWTRWYDKHSEIWYARSVDGGYTFGPPRMLYSSRLNNFGSVPVIGHHGRMYIFWSVFPDTGLTATTPTQIYFRSSANDGKTFGAARAATKTFSSIPHMTTPGFLRNLTMPAVAVTRAGAIVMSYARVSTHHPNGSVDADIVLTQSTDDGRTWSDPRVVNDVQRGDRFMPSLNILSDGSLGIAYYDRRVGWWDLGVYATRATFDGGFHVSKNVRVNAGTSPVGDIYYLKPGSTCFSPGRFFGDYIGTSSLPDGSMCVVWADTQSHQYDDTDIWFARVRIPAIVAYSERAPSLGLGHWIHTPGSPQRSFLRRQ